MVGQPDPNAIAKANPDPLTPADREVPIHGWCLVVHPVVWLCVRAARTLVLWVLRWWVSTANRSAFVVLICRQVLNFCTCRTIYAVLNSNNTTTTSVLLCSAEIFLRALLMKCSIL